MSTPATRVFPANARTTGKLFIGDLEVPLRPVGIDDLEVIVRGPPGAGKTTLLMLFERLFSRFYHDAEPSPMRRYADEGGFAVERSDTRMSDRDLKHLFDGKTIHFRTATGLPFREPTPLPEVKWQGRDPEDKPCGYHVSPIPQGVFGEFSKIEEEVAELKDAREQGCGIMELVELADLFGAIRGYLANYHPEITMRDLEVMAGITERAFTNGARQSKGVVA